MYLVIAVFLQTLVFGLQSSALCLLPFVYCSCLLLLALVFPGLRPVTLRLLAIEAAFLEIFLGHNRLCGSRVEKLLQANEPGTQQTRRFSSPFFKLFNTNLVRFRELPQSQHCAQNNEADYSQSDPVAHKNLSSEFRVPSFR